jgi:hypothetical protein
MWGSRRDTSSSKVACSDASLTQFIRWFKLFWFGLDDGRRSQKSLRTLDELSISIAKLPRSHWLFSKLIGIWFSSGCSTISKCHTKFGNVFKCRNMPEDGIVSDGIPHDGCQLQYRFLRLLDRLSGSLDKFDGWLSLVDRVRWLVYYSFGW